jgi:hypothetical protein
MGNCLGFLGFVLSFPLVYAQYPHNRIGLAPVFQAVLIGGAFLATLAAAIISSRWWLLVLLSPTLALLILLDRLSP